MNKFKKFVQDRKSEIITGVAVASAVLVAVAVASNSSRKDEIRFHKDAIMYSSRNDDDTRMHLRFVNPDGSSTPTLKYKTHRRIEPQE